MRWKVEVERLNNALVLMRGANENLRRQGEDAGLGEALCDLIEEARDYIEQLRTTIAGFVEADGTGYFPFVADDFCGIGQTLVQVFREDDGTMTCSLAHRADQWETWSPPTKAVPG
jgi:hypothetical protein